MIMYSTDSKTFVIKYAKMINGTKKEYQKLYAENIKYREKTKRQEQLDEEINRKTEKELTIYEIQKQ